MGKARLVNAAAWFAFWLALAIVFDGFADFPHWFFGQAGMALLAWLLSDWALRRIRQQRAHR